MGRGRATGFIRYDARQWIRGLSTSIDSFEGGFSPASYGLNLISSPGVIKASSRVLTTATNALGSTEFIFNSGMTNVNSGNDLTTFATYDGSFDGRFYKLNFLTGALTLVATDTTKDWKTGVSQGVQALGKQFNTSNTDILRANYDYSSLKANWWTDTVVNGGVNQPALTADVYHGVAELGGDLYVADGRYIHVYDGTTVSNQAVDFSSQYQIIRMVSHGDWIYAVLAPYKVIDVDIFRTGCKLVSWRKQQGDQGWDLEIPLQSYVTDMYSDNGILYVKQRDDLLVLTGNSLSSIKNTIYQSRALVDKRTFFMQPSNDAAGHWELLCYSAILNGRERTWAPIWLSSSTSFASVWPSVLGRLLIQDGRDIKTVLPITPSTSGAPAHLVNNKTPLPAYSYIRSIEIETEKLESGDSFSVSYVDTRGDEHSLGTFTDVGRGGKTFDVNVTQPTFTVQPIVDIVGGRALRSVTVGYEPAEQKGS